jgi:hypothetical protein
MGIAGRYPYSIRGVQLTIEAFFPHRQEMVGIILQPHCVSIAFLGSLGAVPDGNSGVTSCPSYLLDKGGHDVDPGLQAESNISIIAIQESLAEGWIVRGRLACAECMKDSQQHTKGMHTFATGCCEVSSIGREEGWWGETWMLAAAAGLQLLSGFRMLQFALGSFIKSQAKMAGSCVSAAVRWSA